MKDWPHTMTRMQAITLIDSATSRDDPYWENATEDYYDEETDTMPSIMHVFAALGVTEDEYKAATGTQNVKWPVSPNAQ